MDKDPENQKYVPQDEDKYLKGFNSGFVLAQFEPEIADGILDSAFAIDEQGNVIFNDYLEGQKDGIREWQEKFKADSDTDNEPVPGL